MMMTEDTINILCATDDNYFSYCGIMLTSLYENNRGVEINTYILTGGLNRDSLNSLSRLSELYQTKIETITLADDILLNCPIWPGDHVSIAAYYRLLSATVLPVDVKKILYLDCDIIIARSLTTLWNTDISDYFAATVIDSGYFDEQRNKLVGLENPKHYFNSGVLLINVEKWREKQIWNQFLGFINTHQDNLHSHDQDVLNAVLKGRVKYLPLTYNFQDFYLFRPYFNRYDDVLKQQILEVKREDVVVWHMSMPVKPLKCWHWAYPFDTIWHQYKRNSLWRFAHLSQPFCEQVRSSILKLSWRLGIAHNPMDFIKRM